MLNDIRELNNMISFHKAKTLVLWCYSNRGASKISEIVMKKLKNSKVHFNNPDKVYKSGDTLTGHVEINLDSSQTVKNVYITISGKASVYWQETESRIDENGSTRFYYYYYSNSEQYINENIYVLGNDSESKLDLAAGQHAYPFKYILPPNLPPTYGTKTSVGDIIYKVTAILNQPWKINKYTEEKFIIETNNSQDPIINEPQTMTIGKQFGVIFKSKPLTVTVKTPQRGFHAGKIIPLTIEVDNQSDTIVKSISVKLREISKFYGTIKTRTDEKTISKNHITNEIPAKKSLFFDHSLTVPTDLVPFDLSNCKIIDILYEIRVELHTAGLTKNLVGSMPIIPIKLSE